MSINNEYLHIGERRARLLGQPRISGIYLPPPVPDETFRDEFGFVFLADGSQTPVELIGPSGSVLPDPLLARGVATIGGVSFNDRERLTGQSQPAGSVEKLVRS